MNIKIGVPAKGRLSGKSLDWLRSNGLGFNEPDLDRRYSVRAAGVVSAELVFLPAGEIPEEIRRGNLMFGITGADLVHEQQPDWRQRMEIQAELGFGNTRLMIAVPQFWIDVESVHDLDDVAARFRAEHGWGLRIATKYHSLVREFLRGIDLTDYRLVDSQGATEGTVANEMAEAIADLVSTGETLTANGLKTLSDGLVFKSQAIFIRSREVSLRSSDRPDIQEIMTWR
ncbi:MAG: ATP phosphoribosyltransferase [Rhodobacteraceae bacterium]|nr:ATP phosphoribosyltransferase [Paracoccaceae bacterium]